jgi:hypothetical protein
MIFVLFFCCHHLPNVFRKRNIHPSLSECFTYVRICTVDQIFNQLFHNIHNTFYQPHVSCANCVSVNQTNCIVNTQVFFNTIFFCVQ